MGGREKRGDEVIHRDKRNIGKRVRYVNVKSPWYGRETVITGFRGDGAKGVPHITLADGNSIPANQLAIIK
jgi:hypothetical protein